MTLYEALTLQRPFPEDNDGQTVHAIVNGVLRAPLEQLRPDLPETLVALVRRCLAREPEQRFADCHDLALELERVASSAGHVTAKLIGNWVERLVPQPPSLRPLDTEASQPSPGRGAFGARQPLGRRAAGGPEVARCREHPDGSR